MGDATRKKLKLEQEAGTSNGYAVSFLKHLPVEFLDTFVIRQIGINILYQIIQCSYQDFIR